MNRTKAGWGQYFTEPLPNIGLFLCRGNNRTARVFELAWNKYLGMVISCCGICARKIPLAGWPRGGVL
jgi:hypothetical protein